jgi:hypothetical protein
MGSALAVRAQARKHPRRLLTFVSFSSTRGHLRREIMALSCRKKRTSGMRPKSSSRLRSIVAASSRGSFTRGMYSPHEYGGALSALTVAIKCFTAYEPQ